MKNKLIDGYITNNEDLVRLRVFDGVIPLGGAGDELLELERARANSYGADNAILREEVRSLRERLVAKMRVVGEMG